MDLNKAAKRGFDLFWAVVGLLALSPLLLVISLLIVLGDGKSVFFAQERIGHKGKPFRILKFRTMVVDAEKKGKQITVGQDYRITPVGRWLRATKLDELPQLFNVLKGDMSFVGPRPEVPHYVAFYNQEQRNVLNSKPGITDHASIKYRHESEILARSPDPERTYIEKIMPEKIRLNLEYAAKASLGTDIMVIVKTIFALFVSE